MCVHSLMYTRSDNDEMACEYMTILSKTFYVCDFDYHCLRLSLLFMMLFTTKLYVRVVAGRSGQISLSRQ